MQQRPSRARKPDIYCKSMETHRIQVLDLALRSMRIVRQAQRDAWEIRLHPCAVRGLRERQQSINGQ